MIIFVSVNLKQLFADQKKYPWSRPEYCPRCKINRVWGHGFVLAYFDNFSDGVYLRRYRCPQCGCIIRIRPKGFFRRFQASTNRIRASLWRRIAIGRYLPGISSCRQRHWLNNLKRMINAYLGNRWNQRLLDGFDCLVARGHVPVSSAI